MSKTIKCDHFVGYIGSDDANASLIRASQNYTFSDFAAEGMMFQFCPLIVVKKSNGLTQKAIRQKKHEYRN